MSQVVQGRVVDEADPDIDSDVDEARTVAFEGKRFKVADRFGLMPLLKFAHVAKQGMNTDDMESLAVMYDVLAQAIHPDHWDAFCQHATNLRADADTILPVVQQAIAVMTARPTERPSDSSDGPTATDQSSQDGSFSLAFSTPATRRGPIMADPRVQALRPVAVEARAVLAAQPA